MQEVWKDIKGYEGFYKVSNTGRVKRVEGYKLYRGNKVVCHENITIGQDNGKGYLRTKLTLNNKPKAIMVHRLVAEAFIPNPLNKKCVNHIDGDKKNNNLANLEWLTHSENRQHAIQSGLVDMKKLKKACSENGKRTVVNIQGWNSKKVLNTITGEIYKSISHAAKVNKLSRRSFHDQLTGKRKNTTHFVLNQIPYLESF